jgi:hypothetical protein
MRLVCQPAWLSCPFVGTPKISQDRVATTRFTHRTSGAARGCGIVSHLRSGRPMQFGPNPGRRLILAHLEHAPAVFDVGPGAPPGDASVVSAK